VSGDWTRYWAWNEAIAAQLFSDEAAGRPVYLALEDDELAELCDRLGEPADQGAAPLVDAVKETLEGAPGRNDFRDHLEVLEARQDPLETPTTLALLVVLASAAAQMDAADGLAAHNYYGRLHRLLGLSEEEANRRRLTADYQRSAEELWAPLNEWLVAWDGLRGVPTAYAVGMRYIGLPMSQALVRRRDRNVLHRIFAAEGLPPGFRIGAADIERIVNGWVNRVPSHLSGAFRALWSSPAARERMAGVAAIELENWSGADLLDQESPTQDRAMAARLAMTIRSFPSSRVEFTLAIPDPTGTGAATLSAQTTEGEVELATIPTAGGWLRPTDASIIDPDSLLGDRLDLTEVSTGRRFAREARPVVVMRHDPLQGAFVETDHVELGELSTLVVAAPYAERARAVLASVARPGYRELEPRTAGVPAGWVVIRDVYVVARFEGTLHVDLRVLVPTSGSSLSLMGGIQMPGHLRKWSTIEPPEIQAVSESADRLRIRIDRGGRVGDAVFEQTYDDSIAVLPIKEIGLDDGEYLVTVYADAGTRPVATSVLRLRSAASMTPETMGEIGSLKHSARQQGARWAVSATPDIVESDWLVGLEAGPEFGTIRELVSAANQPTAPARPSPAMLAQRHPGPAGGAPDPMPPARPRPRRTVQTAPVKQLRVGRGLGADSCMRTGAHRFTLPTVRPEAPRSAFIESECEKCGLQKRFPTTGRRRRDPAASRRSVLHIPHVEELPTDERVGAIFDAMCHLGGGSFNAFARLAGHVDPSAVYSDSLLRKLEVLGHVEVDRLSDGRASRWAMTPPHLVPLESGRPWLVGWRSPALLLAIEAAAGAWGGSVVSDTDEGIPHVEIHAIDGSLLEDVVAEVDYAAPTLTVTRVDAMTIVRTLPSFRRLLASLPRHPLPALRTVERWDPVSASWEPASRVDEIGAYRLHGALVTYGYRDQRAILEGTFAIGSAHVVKHIANAVAGDILAGFYEPVPSVVVPLGADLPGVYGRALVRGSGRLPRRIPAQNMVQYREVARDVADVLAEKLRS
jgi:hypothetical protein